MFSSLRDHFDSAHRTSQQQWPAPSVERLNDGAAEFLLPVPSIHEAPTEYPGLAVHLNIQGGVFGVKVRATESETEVPASAFALILSFRSLSLYGNRESESRNSF